MSIKEKSNPYRRNAAIVGILFIVATTFLFLGQAFYDPVLDSPENLEIAYPNRIMATIGMLIEFSCVLAIPLIPEFLLPIHRKHSETLAIGYVIFRFLGAVLFVLFEINKLSLINASQNYLASGSADASFYQNIYIAARNPLAEAKCAHALLERGGYAGKIVFETKTGGD